MGDPRTESDLVAMAERNQRPDDSLLLDNPVVAFARGAYSFPFDWTLALHWTLGMQGVYGTEMQRRCQNLGHVMDAMVHVARVGMPATYQITAAVLNYIFRNELTRCLALDAAMQRIDRGKALYGAGNAASGVAGRFAGGMFTLYASTGGRFGQAARTGPQRYGFVASNLVLASTGAIIKLAIKTRGAGVTVVDMALAILAGTSQSLFSNEQWKAIFRAYQTCTLPANAEDQESFRQIFDALHQYSQEARQPMP